MEIVHPDGTRFTHPMPLGYKERLHKLELELTEKCTADGAWVEPKGNILSIRVDRSGENFSKSVLTILRMGKCLRISIYKRQKF